MLKQKTVYFREEDLPLWEAIENKAEWLHEHLEVPHTYKAVDFGGTTYVSDSKDPGQIKIIKTKQDTEKVVPMKSQLHNAGVCKIHGTPLDSRGKCLQKGCKYGK